MYFIRIYTYKFKATCISGETRDTQDTKPQIITPKYIYSESA